LTGFLFSRTLSLPEITYSLPHMYKSRIWKNFALILVFAVFLAFTDNPWKLPALETDIPIITPVWNWMQESVISLGLDLQGGTQLDYEIDLRDAKERNSDEDPDNDVDVAVLIDGVKDVIERRVNSLGVAEPNIYLSSAGEEQHIVVELPGIEDLNEAKEKVGAVVQLEFKEEKIEASEEEFAAIEVKAAAYFEKIQAEESIDDLESYAEDDLVPNELVYEKLEKKFLDDLPEEFQELVTELEVGVFHDELLKAQEVTPVFAFGRQYVPEGYNIVRLVEKSTELRKNPQNAEDFDAVLEDLGMSSEPLFDSFDEMSPSELALEITTLASGQISGVIATDDGFYIGKLGGVLPVDTSDNPERAIRSAHILFLTEEPQELKTELPLKEIPEDATEEERAQIEQDNEQIKTSNAGIVEENERITAANAEIETRNAEKKATAEDVLAQIKEDPSRFEELAREHSEEEGSAGKGGDLGYGPVSGLVKDYSDAALALERGTFSQELVKTQFGYHIIKLIDIKEPDEEKFQYTLARVCFQGNSDCDSTATREEAQASADELLRRVREESVFTMERLWFNALPNPWKSTELDGRFFKRASVAYDQISFRPFVSIQFDDEGAELFEELTGNNVGKRIGIFVGGEFISSPRVNEKISGGNAQITLGTPNVQVALKEANELTRSLNAGSIPAPLRKPDELNIGATLGQESLQKSVNAGLIGLILVALFMMLYYRFLGFIASASLLVYGLFLYFIIIAEVPATVSIAITFVGWIAFALSLFKSKIDGLGKAIFLIFSVIGVLFVFSVLINPIVLTLAGVAGLILSIGMAVDANILIFERVKEEFDDGKSYLLAINDGFDRAWSSILDSNVSTLITCAILFYFGTSIIRGFAVNLAVGVIISMFSAISVTKTFLLLFEGTALEKVNWLWKRKSTARSESSNVS